MVDFAPVQMLWVGGPLSALERLSLTSFLKCGHEVQLYTYGKPANAPRGLKIRDAGEILPHQPGTTDDQRAGAARFSDLFRYKLLHERGGVWADIDMVCLRPLDFAAGAEYFFASEVLPAQPGDEGKIRIRASNCAMKAPAGSPVMLDCLQQAQSGNPQGTGPALLHGALERYNLLAALLNPSLFCPIPFWNFTALVSGPTTLPPESYGVHCWNESWKRNFFDKNAGYDPLCLFERLKAHYLPARAA